MKLLKISAFIIILGSMALPFSCRQDSKNKKIPVKDQDIGFTAEGKLQIYKKDSIQVATLDIEIADNDYERETGLMYRNTMKPNQGMLFIFGEEEPRYFYMKNTQIALDIIYINAEKEIVSIVKNTVPLDETSLPSQAPAKYVLEVNAGLSDQWGLAAGDRISFE